MCEYVSGLRLHVCVSMCVGASSEDVDVCQGVSASVCVYAFVYCVLCVASICVSRLCVCLCMDVVCVLRLSVNLCRCVFYDCLCISVGVWVIVYMWVVGCVLWVVSCGLCLVSCVLCDTSVCLCVCA